MKKYLISKKKKCIDEFIISFISTESEINKHSSRVWIQIEYLCAMHVDRFIMSITIFIKNSNFIKLLNKSVRISFSDFNLHL